MSTIVVLIERIEAERRAMLVNPHVQNIVSAVDEPARQQREFMENLGVPLMVQRVAENMRVLREDLLRQQEDRERALRLMDSLRTLARPVEPQVFRHDHFIEPRMMMPPRDPHIHARRQQEPEPLPKRTIVRPEVKRKIGFSNDGFRPID